jgi:hypothetical protein
MDMMRQGWSTNLIPRFAAVVDEIVVGFEDTVGEPVVAHELPDVLDRVELGAFLRHGENGDVGGNDQSRRQVASGLIDQENGVGTGRDGLGNLREVQVHGLGVAGRQDQGRALALLWADCSEDAGGGGALIPGRARARAAFRPAAGDLVLLANLSLVVEPDFYPGCIEALLTRDCFQARVEAFLKSSITPSA